MSYYQSQQPGVVCLITLIAGTVLFWNPVPVWADAMIDRPTQLAQATPTLAGNWRLVSFTESSAPMPMLVPETPPLTAEFSGDRVFGSGGCNRFMGGFEAEGEQLSVGPLASTFMACENPIMSQEMRYLGALQGAQRYEVTDQGLAIFYQTDQESGVLRFVAQPSDSAETTETTETTGSVGTTETTETTGTTGSAGTTGTSPRPAPPVRALW